MVVSVISHKTDEFLEYITTSNGGGFEVDYFNGKLSVLLDIFCKQRSGLRICHTNAESLIPKIDEFRSLFEISNVNIIC